MGQGSYTWNVARRKYVRSYLVVLRVLLPTKKEVGGRGQKSEEFENLSREEESYDIFCTIIVQIIVLLSYISIFQIWNFNFGLSDIENFKHKNLSVPFPEKGRIPFDRLKKSMHHIVQFAASNQAK